MAWTTPRTWVAGETVTAALLNTHVRDNLKAVGDPWTTYTPTWTAATTNPTIGNGTIAGRYMAAGKYITFEIQIVMGSTTTYGAGAYSLTLPVAPQTSAAKHPFLGTLWDASGGSVVTSAWPIAGLISAGSTVELAGWPATAGNSFRVVNATNVITLADGDRITLTGTYEAA